MVRKKGHKCDALNVEQQTQESLIQGDSVKGESSGGEESAKNASGGSQLMNCQKSLSPFQEDK